MHTKIANLPFCIAGRYLPFKVLNIRIKKEQEEGWSLKCKITNKTEVEGKCSSKIFDHSCLFANILLGFYWRKHLFFFRWKNLLVNSLSKHFVFPAKKLRKIRVFVSRMLWLFKCLLLYNTCLKMVEFSRQKTYEKIRAPKIRMRRCFFCFFSTLWYFLPAIK